MKHITYIIPTLNRESLTGSIKSILNQDPFAKIIIKQGNSAGINRNAGLLSEVLHSWIGFDSSNWIVFLDDDDILREGYLRELEDDYDIVVLKMLQNGTVIPRNNQLVAGNVGINFAIRTEYLRDIVVKDSTIDTSYLFDSLGHAEDWRFLSKILQHGPRVKITDKVYYECTEVNHLKS